MNLRAVYVIFISLILSLVTISIFKLFSVEEVVTTLEKPIEINEIGLNFQVHSLSIKTTVVYIYSGNDILYGENLAYFIRNGIYLDDRIEYYIVFQQGKWESSIDCDCTINCPMNKPICHCKCPSEIRNIIPKNVKLVYHENTCFDIGTFGELLDKKLIGLSNSKYVIVLNSSIRGPFLPSYISKDFKWTEAFTSKINDEVKLVGPTISCGSPLPHVQSFLLATDMVGLNILYKEGALKCYSDQSATVKYSELGASAAILKYGFNIASLMLRYTDIDWRLKKNHNCNHNVNPFPQLMYDGITINPLETLFVKTKSLHLKANWVNVVQANKYTKWLYEAKGIIKPRNINTNEFKKLQPDISSKMLSSFRKECFDYEYYRNSNYDLKLLNWSNEHLLKHYITNGYFEARPGVRFIC